MPVHTHFCALALVAGILAACPLERTARPDTATPRPAASPEATAAFGRAYGHFDRAEWAEAEEAFAAFLEAHPGSSLAPEALYRRGVALNRLGRHEEAAESLQAFRQAHPHSPFARQAAVELGLAERGEEQPPEPDEGEMVRELREAIRAVEKAGGDERASAERHLTELLDRRAGAREIALVFHRLSERSAAYPLVATKVARLHYHLGNYEEAEKVARKAVERGAGERARAVLERLAVRGNARPEAVGVILPMSGRFKAFGEALLDGIKLAIAPRDGIDLMVKDSQGDAALSVKAVEELAAAGASVIIGPLGTAEAAPAATRAEELGIPMILLSRAEGVTAIGPHVFRNSLTNSAQGKALARYATEVLKVKKGAILAPDMALGEELGHAFWEALEDAGGEIRGHESYAHDETTFASTIKRLVARDNLDQREEFRAEAKRIRDAESNPYRRRKMLEKLASQQPPVIDFDVLLVADIHRTVGLIAPALAVEDVITTGCDERDLARIRKTTGRQQLRTVTLLGGAGWNSPDLVQRGGRYVLCSVFVDGFFAGSQREPTRRFVEAFRDQYGRTPSLLEAQAYDTAAIVREIVQRRRPATREAFRATLAGVKNFPGATGTTTFGPDGEADKPLFFLTVEPGGITELDVTLSPAGLVGPTLGSRAP